MCLIRFLKIRSHLGQDLSVRNPNIYSKMKFFPHRITNVSSGSFRRGILRRDRGIIHITFINADLFNVRADTRQMFHEQPAFFVVHGMIWRGHDQMRTFPQGVDHRLPRSDTEGLGGDGFGQYHAMSGGSIAPHNGGNGAQIHGISLRQTLQCRPA